MDEVVDAGVVTVAPVRDVTPGNPQL